MSDETASEQPMDIRTMCIAAHEYFASLREAGFSQPHSLYLTACILAGGPKLPPGSDGP